MSASNTWENDLMLLVFNNTTSSLIGDSTGIVGSTTPGSLYISLHTSDPGEAGTQSTNEATYGSYDRVAVARDSSGWTVSTNTASNTSTVTFPQCSSGSNTITHIGIGTSSSGSGKLLYSGALGSSLAVSTNITPAFSSGTGITISCD